MLAYFMLKYSLKCAPAVFQRVYAPVDILTIIGAKTMLPLLECFPGADEHGYAYVEKVVLEVLVIKVPVW